MSRTPFGNNASLLARGNRTAAHLTHGVVCGSRDCRTFDPNVSKKHDGLWRCERHGGANNHARANAKDEEFSNGVPGAARRERLARFRAKQKKQTASAYTAHIPTFLDRKPAVPKKKAKSSPVIQAKSKKQLQREAAMAKLGLTEADILKFAKSN
jgi:aryl-alcohol dehydrogenase-like predicted oxidoreductase